MIFNFDSVSTEQLLTIELQAQDYYEYNEKPTIN